jgi:hypothetical protein
MAEVDVQNWRIDNLAPLNDAKPSVIAVNIMPDGDGTTAETAKFISQSENNTELAYWTKSGIIYAQKVLSASKRSIDITIDGGGSVISPGVKGHSQRVPYNFRISKVSVLATPSGSITLDLWKAAYADFSETVPGDANSITALTPVKIIGGVKSEDAVLENWIRDISAGDILRVNVDACSGITFCTITLEGSEY